MLSPRDEAIKQGLTQYNSGKPCKYGHTSPRVVSTRTCVECKKSRRKVWPKKAESHRKHMARIRQRDKMAAIEMYGGKCECCGETQPEFLTIDHINGGGNQHRKTTPTARNSWRYVRQHNYPNDFRLLCYNCNQAYSIYGVCPHQTAAMISRKEEV